MQRLFISHILLFIFLIAGIGFAQHIPSKERGDVTLRRKTDIDGNNIRATIFNTGLTGRTAAVPDEIPYEWPKNSGHTYIALTAIWIGAEFPDIIDDDGAPLRIVDVVQYRESPDGRTWNFEPVPGYNNPDYLVELDADGNPTGNKKVGIAKSTDPNSWPPTGWADKMDDPVDPGWIGSWNGFFGKNIFNADQELFFKMSDDLYDRKLYLFQPDATDPSRGGLGLLAEVRVMAWSQVLVNDVVYVINNIENDGTEDLDRTGFAIWLADVIGFDTQNDKMNYDLSNDLATMDDDEVGFGSAGVSFLETPGNAVDRIDNDGDGEEGPRVTAELIVGEGDLPVDDPRRRDGIDNNGNGLIDEDTTYIAFGTQTGVGYADGIDNNLNGEANSPTVTAQMVADADGDMWHRWPPFPENDPVQNGEIHLIMVESDDIGQPFADNIDNDGNGEDSSNVVTQAMIDAAASDPYHRYPVPGTDIILYDVGPEDLGKIYADGIDNDGDRIIDEGIDEGIDEMIDESREDGIDNDGDWDPLTDDVGLDGVAGTGDPGEGDGKPTSGAGTNFPGEPNIDKTDISESDQLGITNVQRFPANTIQFNSISDRALWLTYIVPGEFWQLAPGELEEGDNDLTVSSSVFPMKSGSIQRISYAVILGDNPEDVVQTRDRAQETYNADYQFAKAPATPILRAVPGDNKVTLYWDSKAEQSFDGFLAKLGLNGYDFEGYRLYRSRDPAFEDVFTITDGNGSRTFHKPIAQWDLVDGWQGFSSVDVNGVQFYLGDETGLKHSFVDTDVKNGFTYFYALTAYDFGAPAFDIAPAESPMLITLDEFGKARLGRNVVEVTPEAPVAGYKPAEIVDFVHLSGGASGQIGFEIIDPRLIKDDNTYEITFEDTLIEASGGGEQDTLTTKSFTLVNVTDSAHPDTLIAGDTAPRTGLEAPLADGIRLNFVNPEAVEISKDQSKLSRDDMFPLIFKVFKEGVMRGNERPADYEIEFADQPGLATSTEFKWRRTNTQTIVFPPKPVNFRIKNLTTDEFIQFGFMEAVGNDGIFNADTVSRQQTDIIVFLEKNANDSLVVTWSLKYELGQVLGDSTKSFPGEGDFAKYVLIKPFLSFDVFQYTTKGESVDKELAKQDLDRVKVVPNPYLAASSFEPRNPFRRGRGPRRIHFIHLPQRCTIRIFTVSGELVDVIEHNSSINDGTAEWDLLTRDNLSVAYGVYIYHLEAPGIGEKIGKFAIIK